MQDRQIILTRLIAAPVAKVWQCWTDPAMLPRWFGPEGYFCVTKEIDLRQGGLWRFDMTGPDGKIWANRHRYTLFDPFKRLEFLLDGDDDSVTVSNCWTVEEAAAEARTALNAYAKSDDEKDQFEIVAVVRADAKI